MSAYCIIIFLFRTIRSLDKQMKNARKSSDPNSKAVKDFLACLSIRMNIIRNPRGSSSSVPIANVISTAPGPSLLTPAPVTPSPIATPVLPSTNHLPNIIPTPATPPPVIPATPNASTPVSPLPTNVLKMRNALCGVRSSDNLMIVGRLQTQSGDPGNRTPTSKSKASSADSTPVKNEKASRYRAYLRAPRTPSTPASQPHPASSSPSTPPSSSTNRLYRACRLMSPSSM